MESGKLLTESEVFEDEILAGTKSTDNPAEHMPELQNHDKNLNERRLLARQRHAIKNQLFMSGVRDPRHHVPATVRHRGPKVRVAIRLVHLTEVCVDGGRPLIHALCIGICDD